MKKYFFLDVQCRRKRENANLFTQEQILSLLHYYGIIAIRIVLLVLLCMNPSSPCEIYLKTVFLRFTFLSEWAEILYYSEWLYSLVSAVIKLKLSPCLLFLLIHYKSETCLLSSRSLWWLKYPPPPRPPNIFSFSLWQCM